MVCRYSHGKAHTDNISPASQPLLYIFSETPLPSKMRKTC